MPGAVPQQVNITVIALAGVTVAGGRGAARIARFTPGFIA